MKKILPLFICAIFLSYHVHGQFVEEFRSGPNRRPPSSLLGQIDGFREILDINDNGSPDIISVFRDSLFVRDGYDREVILGWKIEEGQTVVLDQFNDRPPGTGFEKIKVTFIAGYSLDKSSTKLTLYEISNSGRVQKYNDHRFIGIADFDSGGKPEILTYDTKNKQTVILGYENADLDSDEPEIEDVIEPLGLAYSLELKFESEQKRYLVGSRDQSEALHKFDIDGDGQPEIVMFIENDLNEEVGIEVLNARSKSLMWSFRYPVAHLSELQKNFHGFFDVNGDGESELIYGNKTVVTLDKEVHEIDPNFELVMIRDIDDDGFPDLLGKGRADTTVQVWGKASSTATFDEMKKSNLQVKASPNPFSEKVAIEFLLEEVSDVSLQICDASGKVLETLINGPMQSGNHNVDWHPSIGNSGLYYAKLVIDETVTILPILRIN